VVINNKHNCPKKIWDKLSPHAKATYNTIYNVSAGNILPLKKLDKKDFEVMRHNYACLAAWSLDAYIKSLTYPPAKARLLK
jgi:hypothetical protein